MKKKNALAGIDAIIAIIAIIIFSTLILVLMTNNAIENVRIAKETMAMIYITDIFENIGIQKYEDITQDNIENFFPKEALNNYQIEAKVEKDLENIQEGQDIIKRITITLKYQIGDKTYECSKERLKIRE